MNTSISSTQINNLPIISCLYHDNVPITHFCAKEACLMPLCSICIPIHSQEHEQQCEEWQFDTIDSIQKKQRKLLMIQMEKFHELENEIDNHQVQDKKQMIQNIKQQVFKAIETFFDDMEKKYCKVDIDSTLNDIQETINQIQKYYKKLQKQDLIKFLILSKQSDKDREAKYHSIKQQIQKQIKQNKISFNTEIAKEIKNILENQFILKKDLNHSTNNSVETKINNSARSIQIDQNQRNPSPYKSRRIFDEEKQKDNQASEQIMSNIQIQPQMYNGIPKPRSISPDNFQEMPNKNSYNQYQGNTNPIILVHPSQQQQIVFQNQNQQNIQTHHLQQSNNQQIYHDQQAYLKYVQNEVQQPESQYTLINAQQKMPNYQQLEILPYQQQLSPQNQQYYDQTVQNNQYIQSPNNFQQTKYIQQQIIQNTPSTIQYNQVSNSNCNLVQQVNPQIIHNTTIQKPSRQSQNNIVYEKPTEYLENKIPIYKSPFSAQSIVENIKNDGEGMQNNQNIQNQLELNNNLILKAKSILQKNLKTNQDSFDSDTSKILHNIQEPSKQLGDLDAFLKQQNDISERLQKIKLNQNFQV